MRIFIINSEELKDVIQYNYYCHSYSSTSTTGVYDLNDKSSISILDVKSLANYYKKGKKRLTESTI